MADMSILNTEIIGNIGSMSTHSLVNLTNVNDQNDEDESPTLLSHSFYYNEDSIDDILKKETIKILSLNCQSLNAKFSEFQLYIKNFTQSNYKFNVICLQETWLDSNSDLSLLQLEDYTLISQSRSCSAHGGVCIYLDNSFKYKPVSLPDHLVNSPMYDCQFIEIPVHENANNQNTKLIIGNIYRPPRETLEDYTKFQDNLNHLLSIFQKNNHEVIIAGDYNIDLLKFRETNKVNEYFNTIIANGFIPKITFPTRLTASNGTLIDNFLVKISKHFSETKSGILISDLSDHLPYFLCLDYLNIKQTRPKYIIARCNNTASLENFKNELQNIDFKTIMENTDLSDTDKNFEAFNNAISCAMNKHMPIKIVKYNKHKHKKCDWMTKGIIHSITYRDRLYADLKRTLPHTLEYSNKQMNLKVYNCILKRNIRLAKKSYYQSCFNKYKDDVKKTWTTIKDIINKKHGNHEAPAKLLVDNNYIENTEQIANEFNAYFTTIGPKLASEIRTHPTLTYKRYLAEPVNKSFNFKSIDQKVVKAIIDKLKPKTSCGHDNISNKILKYVKNELIIPLTILINQSLSTGVFPNMLKLAKVIPLYKSNEDYLLNNYRPISLLSTFSKIYERVIHDQLHEYFTMNNLYFQSQYGYRENHSTELAALELVDKIITEMDRNEIPLNIYLDMSKAFDTIDHTILLYKMKHYGIKESAYKLIENYLTGRKQYVEIDNLKSNYLPLSTGVPQGSILGPLFFLIYVNDLAKASKLFSFVVYADDTTLSATIRTFLDSEVPYEIKVNKELDKIAMWIELNKLSLNISKTKFMVFHNKQKKVNLPKLSISGIEIEPVDEFNFLGITIDKNVSWKSHIDKITKKISKVIGIMNKLKHILPSSVLLTIYNSLAFPHINYGILCWGYSNTNSILKLQKKAARIITNSKYNAHSDPLFKTLKILKCEHICALQEFKFCYKLMSKKLPSYFTNNIFKKFSEVHSYATRNRNNMQLYRTKHAFAKNSLRYKIPVAYNNMPLIFKEKISTHSLPGFSKYIKNHFISSYINQCTNPNCFSCQ